MFKRIYLRHRPLFEQNIEVWIDAVLDSRDNYFTSRLYVNPGEGDSEKNSIARKVESGTRRIVFDLTEYESINSIRFDPVDTFCVVEIEKIEVKYSTGKVVILNMTGSNALYKQKAKLLFHSKDPQCFLQNFSNNFLADSVELSVDLHFHALGEQALTYIVEFQENMSLSTIMVKIVKRIRWTAGNLYHQFTGSP